MTPLLHNLTTRLWVTYAGPAGQHEVLFRFAAEVESADAASEAQDVCQALKVFLVPATSFVSARFSEALSNVSFPVPWSVVAGTSSDSLTANHYPNFVSWVGRDANGIRTRVTLNGVPASPDENYRLTTVESAAVGSVLTALRATSPSLVTAGALEPIWNDYANIGVNAYFQRKRRRSA